jgi:mono/diheme cytochrome c family protein
MRSSRFVIGALAAALGASTLAPGLLLAGASPGSSSGAARNATPGRTPTFNRDVAPIVFAHCAACHRPGEAAPFSLMTYRDVKVRGSLIEAVTKSGQMPPWKAGKADCELKDMNVLTPGEIALVGRWVDGGMREGRPADLPTLPKFTQGWQIGPPDMIVKMDRPYHVPADGPDIYRSFVVPLHLSEDKWVTAIEYKPSARNVVHHCLFFYDATGGSRARDGRDGEPGFYGASPFSRGGGRPGLHRGFGSRAGQAQAGAGSGSGGAWSGASGGAGARGGGSGNGWSGGGGSGGGFSGGLDSIMGLLRTSLGGEGGTAADPGTAPIGSIGGWAVGANAMRLPDGMAYHLPKNSDLVLSAHFHMSGKAQMEQSEVGIYFAKTPPDRQFTSVQLPPIFGAIKGIDIGAGEKAWALKDSFVLPVDVKAFGVTGHAHMICRTMALTATLPDGAKRTLFTIPNWDFAWQGQYQFKQLQTLPKGTRLDVTITYDNSSDNPSNPHSPPKRMHWGEQSTDEMGSINLQAMTVNEQDMPMLKRAYFQHVEDQMKQRMADFMNRKGGDDWDDD